MKLGPVRKIDNRNKTTLKKTDNDVISQNVMSLLFFQFMANLEQFGSQIQDI